MTKTGMDRWKSIKKVVTNVDKLKDPIRKASKRYWTPEDWCRYSYPIVSTLGNIKHRNKETEKLIRKCTREDVRQTLQVLEEHIDDLVVVQAACSELALLSSIPICWAARILKLMIRLINLHPLHCSVQICRILRNIAEHDNSLLDHSIIWTVMEYIVRTKDKRECTILLLEFLCFAVAKGNEDLPNIRSTCRDHQYTLCLGGALEIIIDMMKKFFLNQDPPQPQPDKPIKAKKSSKWKLLKKGRKAEPKNVVSNPRRASLQRRRSSLNIIEEVGPPHWVIEKENIDFGTLMMRTLYLTIRDYDMCVKALIQSPNCILVENIGKKNKNLIKRPPPLPPPMSLVPVVEKSSKRRKKEKKRKSPERRKELNPDVHRKLMVKFLLQEEPDLGLFLEFFQRLCLDKTVRKDPKCTTHLLRIFALCANHGPPSYKWKEVDHLILELAEIHSQSYDVICTGIEILHQLDSDLRVHQSHYNTWMRTLELHTDPVELLQQGQGPLTPRLRERVIKCKDLIHQKLQIPDVDVTKPPKPKVNAIKVLGNTAKLAKDLLRTRRMSTGSIPIGLTTPLSPSTRESSRESGDQRKNLGSMIKNHMVGGTLGIFAKSAAAAKNRWSKLSNSFLGGDDVEKKDEKKEDEPLNPDDLPIYLQQLVAELNVAKEANKLRDEEEKQKQEALQLEERNRIHQERVETGCDILTGLPVQKIEQKKINRRMSMPAGDDYQIEYSNTPKSERSSGSISKLSGLSGSSSSYSSYTSSENSREEKKQKMETSSQKSSKGSLKSGSKTDTRRGSLSRPESKADIRQGTSSRPESKVDSRLGNISRPESKADIRQGTSSRPESKVDSRRGNISRPESKADTRRGSLSRPESKADIRQGTSSRPESKVDSRLGNISRPESKADTRRGSLSRPESKANSRTGKKERPSSKNSRKESNAGPISKEKLVDNFVHLEGTIILPETEEEKIFQNIANRISKADSFIASFLPAGYVRKSVDQTPLNQSIMEDEEEQEERVINPVNAAGAYLRESRDELPYEYNMDDKKIEKIEKFEMFVPSIDPPPVINNFLGPNGPMKAYSRENRIKKKSYERHPEEDIRFDSYVFERNNPTSRLKPLVHPMTQIPEETKKAAGLNNVPMSEKNKKYKLPPLGSELNGDAPPRRCHEYKGMSMEEKDVMENMPTAVI